MMGCVERLLIAVVLGVLAALVAVLVARRTSGAPSTSGSHTVPAQLRRSDFDGAAAPWLVVVFASETCDACAAVWAKAELLAADEVAVQRVEAGAEKALHDRYGIDAVPLTVVADSDGVVVASFLGPVSATDLWAAVARLRAPAEEA